MINQFRNMYGKDQKTHNNTNSYQNGKIIGQYFFKRSWCCTNVLTINKIRCKRKTFLTTYRITYKSSNLTFLKTLHSVSQFTFAHYPCNKTSLIFYSLTCCSLLALLFCLIPLCYFCLCLFYHFALFLACRTLSHLCVHHIHVVGKPPEGRAFVHLCIPHIQNSPCR